MSKSKEELPVADPAVWAAKSLIDFIFYEAFDKLGDKLAARSGYASGVVAGANGTGEDIGSSAGGSIDLLPTT